MPLLPDSQPVSDAPAPGAVRTAGVLGLGTALPDEVVESEEIALRLGVDPEWIVKRTGIHSRRRAAAGASLNVLAAEAGSAALADFAAVQFGVQIGTTSQEAVEAAIAPSEDPKVYDTSNDVVTALKQEQVEAIVVDVPTAFFLTAVPIKEATTVGQFSAPGGDEWGALLERDSPLTDCVSAAIEELRSSGELAEIEQRWIAEKTKAPVLE